jgi:hypothetical protein
MEKYGVSNKDELQKKELEQVKTRKDELTKAHEKTAADTQEIERLTTREAELKEALSQQ